MNNTTSLPQNADQRSGNPSLRKPRASRGAAWGRWLGLAEPVGGVPPLALALALLASLLLLSSPSLAGVPATLPGAFTGTPPSYGHDFVNITHPGNRDMLPTERVYNNPLNFASQVNVGAVPYEYRIARTEVTSAQWLPFIQLAWPVLQEAGVNLYSSASTGGYIIATATGPGNPNYALLPGRGNHAPSVTFRAAAIYCNWLHNGAPTGPNVNLNVFRSGVYDTSTFTRNPDGSYNDQINRAEGALFWIPTLDEWTKAVFYDPNRYGQAQEGYWRYTYGNEPPVYGEFGDPLAQWGTLNGEQPPVGSFPNAMTPWGLLDAAGSVDEWTDTSVGPGNPWSRYVRGSSSSGGASANANDGIGYRQDPLGIGGIRIASAIPAPSTMGALALLILTHARRSRRCHM